MKVCSTRCGRFFVITGISFGATPRLDLAGTAVGICSIKAHIVNHAKNSHAHGDQNLVEGGREEPGEPRLHGVSDEAVGKVGTHRHEEGVGDDDADRAGLVAFPPGAEGGTQRVLPRYRARAPRTTAAVRAPSRSVRGVSGAVPASAKRLRMRTAA